MNSTTNTFQSKIFYGWIIAFASMTIYAVVGAPVVGFGIFIKPMALDFGWGRGLTTGAIGLYIIGISLFSIIGGILVDRSGPRVSAFIGALTMGGGMLLTSRITNIWQFYLSFSMLASLGTAMITVPLQATLSRWFIKKRGLALGLFFAGGGIGGLIAAPVFQYWIDNGGWQTAFFNFGIVALIVVGSASLLLRKEPADMGLKPLGSEETNDSGNPDDEASSPQFSDSKNRDMTLGEAFKTSAYWLYGIANVLLYMGALMVSVNFVPHATDNGIPAATAALALGISSMASAFGRLSIGAISDKIGTKASYYFCLTITYLMVFWFIFIDQSWALFAFALLFGFSWGGFLPLGPKLITELFGLKSLGSILAVIGIVAGLGTAIGPVLGGILYDRTGSYSLAFTVAGVSIVCAVGVIFLIRMPKRPIS